MTRLFIVLVALFTVCGISEASQTPKAVASSIWLGTLTVGSSKLRLQFHLDPVGGACSIDSLDQGAKGIACSELQANGPEISFTAPLIHAKFRGTVATDGKTLTGTWTQGMDLPLTLTRQDQVLAIKRPKLDPALPPVQLDELKNVLDADLAGTIQSGLLSPTQHGGITIGVLRNGKRIVLSYGEAKPDSLFEIGSITKTFTGLILAQMVQQKSVTLETPLRELLPAGLVTKPPARELTLLDLSIQHSGLPRLPGNLHPANLDNPYADYSADQLYRYLAQRGVAVALDAPFVYSNLGVGLLGQALADRAGLPYPELLQRQVTEPLGLADTVISLSPAQGKRFAQGHDADHQPTRTWDFGALAGAGAIRSTAGDLLSYLQAQLHPDQLAPAATAAARTLPSAIGASHVLHGDAGPGMHIALNWFHLDNGEGFWHNGATGGFSSYVAFSPDHDFGIVVLCNTASNGFTDTLGVHIAQRLMGKPSIALDV